MDNSKNSGNLQELLLEHDQLRKEILHNETISVQVLAAIAIVIPSLLALGFSDVVTESAIKACIFFLAELIAFIGLSQSLDRESAIFFIASYLRTFTESKLEDLRWETRLSRFRQIQPPLVYGDFSNFHVWIYVFFISICFLLGAGFILKAFSSIGIGYGVVATLVAVLITVFLLKHQYRKYIQLSKPLKSFDVVWDQIKQEEKSAKSVSESSVERGLEVIKRNG